MPTRRPARERRPTQHNRGYTYRWQKAARAFRRINPWCAECQKNDIWTYCHPGPETQYTDKEVRGTFEACGCVDHIIPHRGNSNLFWDVDNWQTLCDGRMGSPDCHGKKTREGK